ncbi:cation acetate symporter [Herbaspirillum sp. VT-16-41]|uniref:solute symporter family protein n=1 Tax=Herbaspirillum sp. VT-16-41 TaxID=1953765 RepID=UPI000981936E|nr:cation acetate symporter [Herbaspirillum sp. VT-16-41]ONN64963.1 cation acetate symporter [Herbaspirillum sp. VT-16-41]
MKIPSHSTEKVLRVRSSLSLVAVCMAALHSDGAYAAGLVATQYKNLTLIVFASIIALTLMVTYFAARRGQTIRDFYTGGGISGFKNGFAIAGDYLSAAAFLGASGLIALYGYDGMLYLAGFFVAFVPVMLLIAEPCRNLGRYTLGDILAYRNSFRSSKLVAAVSGIFVSIFYMVPQIVGGAVLIKALVGIEYEISVATVGTLMLIYVFFGGMRATTSVQIIKAILLLSACFILVLLSWAPFGFSAYKMLGALSINPQFLAYMSSLVGGGSGVDVVQRFFEPGLYLTNPLELMSLGFALILGTAAMPHILMRFFTVPDAKTARSSVLWGMLLIGACHLMIFAIGFAAAHFVGGQKISLLDKGGNLAAPILAQYLGGGADSFAGNLMLAFVAAISFATIVAVVAGLTLAAASSLAHDIYVGAIRNGNVSPKGQMIAAKIASVAMGIIATSLGLMAKGQNVAQLVGLAFAVAASANFPALLLTLYWRRCNTVGVVCGVIGGTATAIILVLVSPNMQYPLTQIESAQAKVAKLVAASHQKNYPDLTAQIASAQAEVVRLREGSQKSFVGLERPLIPLKNPGIISIPVGFVLVVLGSLLSGRRSDEEIWNKMRIRRLTGIGREAASEH